MKQKLGTALMAAGIVLLLCAVGLVVYNTSQEHYAAQSSEQYLTVLVDTTPTTIPDVSPSLPETKPTEKAEVEEMPTVVIDGREFIGYMTLPALGLELPVLSQIDDEGLQTAPCRYVGTVSAGNLVIGAHNYSSHFGRLTAMSVGDEIVFTDARGCRTVYGVADMEILDPYAVPDLTSGEYPLTLFTCTYGGAQRIVVRCDRKIQ